MVVPKYWTKTDPKDNKLLVLKTHLSKLDKVNNYSQQTAGPSKRTNPSVHVFNTGRGGGVTCRDMTTLNISALKISRKRLIAMVQSGVGAPKKDGRGI